MLAELEFYLPEPVTGQPDPFVSIVSLNDAPVGIGNYIGVERRSPLASVEVRGGRLDALVRFQLWGADTAEVNTAVLGLQGRLLAARDALWSLGFLKVTSENSSAPLEDTNQNAFGRTADYRVLYEYTFDFVEGAHSLIARIPIHSDPEVLNSPHRETTTVTDAMSRWDNLVAPPLVLRGRQNVPGLTAMAFTLPAAPTGTVTLLRTFDGATTPPQDFTTLPDFHTAVTHPTAPVRSARLVFASLDDFLTALGEIGTPQPLGDWDLDGTTDEYHSYGLAFDPALRLPMSGDRLELVYGSGEEPLDQTAVVYLRARAP
jgi:hypothetical protein